jgi:uncharacterized protein (DUF427 family)
MSEEKRHFFVTSTPSNRVRVYYNDLLLADTEKPLLLKEVGKTVYDQVYYFLWRMSTRTYSKITLTIPTAPSKEKPAILTYPLQARQ